MAKIYDVLEEFEETLPRLNSKGSWYDYNKQQEEWLESLSQWCKVHGSGKYAGEVVRDGVADGYAQYMVFSLRPLQLIHLPLGDAWESRWAHCWTAADIKQMVERERRIVSIFSRKP